MTAAVLLLTFFGGSVPLGGMFDIPIAIELNLHYTVIKFLIRLDPGLITADRVKGRGIVSEARFVPKAIPFFVAKEVFNMQYIKDIRKEDYLDLLATRLAEIRLSELGYRFIPGIYPVFRHFKRFIEARARIVKPEGGQLVC